MTTSPDGATVAIVRWPLSPRRDRPVRATPSRLNPSHLANDPFFCRAFTLQRRALATWYKNDHKLQRNLQPSIMGLAGEAGELLDLLKKDLFKPGFDASPEQYLDELGDCLFYLSIIAWQLEVTLDELSQMNYAKLTERESNGTGYNRGVEV